MLETSPPVCSRSGLSGVMGLTEVIRVEPQLSGTYALTGEGDTRDLSTCGRQETIEDTAGGPCLQVKRVLSRNQPSATQSWAHGLQNPEKITSCHLSHPASGAL